jgi:two-component system chemotaxis sensor kinase CheA
MVDFNMAAYMGVFLDELDEQLQVLDEQLLKLEQDGDDMVTIGTIFRAAHTLKGSSAAMGFEQMKELTHQIENVFEQIRNKQLAVDSTIITLLFQSIDYIKVLKQAIIEGHLEETNIQPLVDSLGKIQQRARGQAASSEQEDVPPVEDEMQDMVEPLIKFNEYEKEVIVQAIHAGHTVMAVHVRIASDTAMKSVRTLLIHNNLKEAGEIITTFPSTEEIEDEQSFQGNPVFILVTRDNEQSISHNLNQISHIDSFHITMITLESVDSYCEEKAIVEAHFDGAGKQTPAKQKTALESKVKVNHTVRVDVDRLECLLNYVGELIIDNTRLLEVKNRLVEQFKDHKDVAVLHDISNHFSRVISELQDGMMKTRMLPIEQLFNRFPRMVRDIAQNAGKGIDFLIEGKETELDRTLIEEISDPIIHILRNAADHGIESPEERVKVGKPAQGKLLLKAAHQENQIVISIADDGRGIDPQKIKQSSIKKGYITEEEANCMTDKELIFLIFKSGVSTAEQITDLSGRGVGMDIVRSHIEKLNGIIDIDTSPGEGAVFTIKLPLTLAIIRSLLVKLGENTLAIPLMNVIEIVRLSAEDVQTIQGQEVCVIRGTVFPLVRMHRRFNLQQYEVSGLQHQRLLVVIVGIADKRACLVMDETVGNQEIVIKSLGKFVGDVPYISGSTILGDGNVALILDVGSLIKEEGSLLMSGKAEMQKKQGMSSKESQFITFKLAAGQYGLDIHKVKEIITIPLITKIVNAPSQLLGIMNLRGALMPVYDLRQCVHLPHEANTPKSRIIVIETEDRDVGVVIDEVLEVLQVPDSAIEAAPASVTQMDGHYIRGIYQKENQFVVLLNIDRVLESKQRMK